MKHILPAACCLMLVAGCFPFPRTTTIRRGISFEGGLGFQQFVPGGTGEGTAATAMLRLNLNPSDQLGFDLGLHGFVYGLSHEPWPAGNVSLGARMRPVRTFNTMLFGEAYFPGFNVGICQGIPATGPELVTLGIAAGSFLVPAFPDSYGGNEWSPLMAFGSLSGHQRFGWARFTASLVGGYLPTDTPLALVALTLQLAGN